MMNSSKSLGLAVLLVLAGCPVTGLAQALPPAPAPLVGVISRPVSQAEARQALAELELYKSNYNQAVAAAQTAAVERDQARADVQRATQTLEACRTQNQAMAKVAEDILEAYRAVGLTDVIKAREPFLGLKRVELENAIQEKSDQIYAARCGVPVAAATPAN